MKSSDEVERWLAALKEPPQQSMRLVHDAIAGGDPRISAFVKYGTLTYAAGGGDLCAFVQWKKGECALMFNRGAKLQGKYPHLEGDGPTARFMRFADAGEAKARAKELAAIAREWCELMAGAGKGTAPEAPKASKAPKAPKKKPASGGKPRRPGGRR